MEQLIKQNVPGFTRPNVETIERFGRYMKTPIAAAMTEAVNWLTTIPSHAIKTTVRKGQVILEGEVECPQQRSTVEQAVRPRAGIKGITNLITVKSNSLRVAAQDGLAETPDVAAAAVEAIKWLTTVPPEAINVTVRGGQLILEGRVEQSQQRSTIEEVLRPLAGIKGIINLITIGSAPRRLAETRRSQGSYETGRPKLP